MNDEVIKRQVLKIILSYLPRHTLLLPSAKFIEDLRMASDDTTAMVLRIERAFNIKGSKEQWFCVTTPRDTINLVVRLLKEIT